MTREIADILNNVPKNYCYPRGVEIEVGGSICDSCKFYENEKCTFDVWKWKGIGSDKE